MQRISYLRFFCNRYSQYMLKLDCFVSAKQFLPFEQCIFPKLEIGFFSPFYSVFVILQKRKITLQNTSDGIKHTFQTDTTKTCQYLLQLCSAQHKFQLQMKARQSNQDAQDIGKKQQRCTCYDCSFPGCNYRDLT